MNVYTSCVPSSPVPWSPPEASLETGIILTSGSHRAGITTEVNTGEEFNAVPGRQSQKSGCAT